MGFSRQEYWSGLPCPSPGDLSDPEIEPGSPALRADSLPPEPPGKSPANKVNLKKSNQTILLLYQNLPMNFHPTQNIAQLSM